MSKGYRTEVCVYMWTWTLTRLFIFPAYRRSHAPNSSVTGPQSDIIVTWNWTLPFIYCGVSQNGRHLSLDSWELPSCGECCSYFQAIYFRHIVYCTLGKGSNVPQWHMFLSVSRGVVAAMCVSRRRIFTCRCYCAILLHVFTHWFQFHQHHTQIRIIFAQAPVQINSVAVSGMHWYGLQ